MDRERQATAFVERVAIDYQASGIWSLLSGGDDSLATAIVTSRALGFRGCLHIDTGIGIPETQAFVVDTCRAQGWPLKIYRAAGQDYNELAIKHGFPGPGAHWRMYIRLKERALEAFIRDHKTHWHDRLILSTGARVAESQRRMGHSQPERRDGVRVWINPINAWSKSDCHETIAAAGIARNPVVELLHMSGECLCGCFAQPNELNEITLWYPATAERIRALEYQVKAAGHDGVWGVRPTRNRKKQPAQRDSAGRRVGPLCQQCELQFQSNAPSRP